MASLSRKLSKLNEVGRLMSRPRDLGPVLDLILDGVREAFEVEACGIVMVDESTGQLRPNRGRGSRDVPMDVAAGRAVQLRQTVQVRSARRSERGDDEGSGPGIELAAPIAAGGLLLGVIVAESRRVEPYSDDDLAVLSAFANQAAVALQNATLHATIANRTGELEHQVRRLELLGKVAQAFASSLDIDELLQTVLHLAREAFHFDHCAVLLLDDERSKLSVRAYIGYHESLGSLEIPVGQGVTGEVARTGTPVLVSDVTHNGRYIAGVHGGRCEMAAPLVARDRILGVLDAESTTASAFSERDLDLFTTFALQAASALARAETYRALENANEKLRRNVIEMERMNRELVEHTRLINETNARLENRVHELLTLQEASRAITSSLDLDETLDAIVRMTRTIIRSSMSAIKLIDEESEELKVRVRQTDGGVEDSSSTEVLGVPLRIGDRVIGLFEVARGDHGTFSEEEHRLIETLASQAAIAIENARLFAHTQTTYFETIRSLAQVLEARDSYTKGHSERVMRYAVRTAEALGIPDTECRLIGHASLLHDIGKIGIADAILNKPAALSVEDRKIIEHHPIWSDNIIGPLRFLEEVQVLVRHHHERFDGAGYPDGLGGREIPLGSRVISVADAFDAMTSDRPYRGALPVEAAVEELRKGSGTQFDPAVVDVFVAIVARFRTTGVHAPPDERSFE